MSTILQPCFSWTATPDTQSENHLSPPIPHPLWHDNSSRFALSRARDETPLTSPHSYNPGDVSGRDSISYTQSERNLLLLSSVASSRPHASFPRPLPSSISADVLAVAMDITNLRRCRFRKPYELMLEMPQHFTNQSMIVSSSSSAISTPAPSFAMTEPWRLDLASSTGTVHETKRPKPSRTRSAPVASVNSARKPRRKSARVTAKSSTPLPTTTIVKEARKRKSKAISSRNRLAASEPCLPADDLNEEAVLMKSSSSTPLLSTSTLTPVTSQSNGFIEHELKTPMPSLLILPLSLPAKPTVIASEENSPASESSSSSSSSTAVCTPSLSVVNLPKEEEEAMLSTASSRPRRKLTPVQRFPLPLVQRRKIDVKGHEEVEVKKATKSKRKKTVNKDGEAVATAEPARKRRKIE